LSITVTKTKSSASLEQTGHRSGNWIFDSFTRTRLGLLGLLIIKPTLH
jgi:hypothetical protein